MIPQNDVEWPRTRENDGKIIIKPMVVKRQKESKIDRSVAELCDQNSELLKTEFISAFG